jgi:hypothetical protein
MRGFERWVVSEYLASEKPTLAPRAGAVHLTANRITPLSFPKNTLPCVHVAFLFSLPVVFSFAAFSSCAGLVLSAGDWAPPQDEAATSKATSAIINRRGRVTI